MSSPHEHAHEEEFHPEEPTLSSFWLNVIGWVGVLFLFAIIIAVTYLPSRGGDVDQAVIDNRFAIRDEVLPKQHDLVSQYKVNADGSVRIPVERAMTLVVDRLNAIPVEAGPEPTPAPTQQAAATEEAPAPEQQAEEPAEQSGDNAQAEESTEQPTDELQAEAEAAPEEGGKEPTE